MKNTVIKFFLILTIVSGIFMACGNPSGPIINETYSIPNFEWKKWQFYSPSNSEGTLIFEDFEGDFITSKNPWTQWNARLSSYAEIRSYISDKGNTNWANSLFPGKASKLCLLSGESRTTSFIKYENLNVTEDANLTFRYFLSIVSGAEFKVFLNGNNQNVVFSEQGFNQGIFSAVKTTSIKIPSGTTSITFMVSNPTGFHYTNLPNGTYVDDISLVYDRVSKIYLTPKSNQKTYVGCAVSERIPVNAYALRSDGTIIEDQDVSITAANGSVSNGFFIPSSAGTSRITASCNGISIDSGEITIFEDNSCQGPCTIAGVTYNGIQTDSGNNLPFNHYVELDFPETDTVTADGFVRIKGRLKEFRIYGGNEYSRVAIVVKNEGNQTIYVCDKEFDIRVWLPFSGENTITIGGAYITTNQYRDVNGNICEGDIKNYSWYSDYVIKATDTHVHTEGSDGSESGSFVYPSYYSQSDNFLVQNTTNEVLSRLPPDASDEAKFQAIHDFIVTHCYYDDSSLSNGTTRKKQDAVSVLKNGTAVCAGYSSLTSAMARYAGIPSKYISSKYLNHAWNHVYVQGDRPQKTWLFCDTTWDDPDKAPDSDRIFYNYFLLDDYNGVNNDHKYDQTVVLGHFAIPEVIDTYEEPELPVLIKDGFWF